TGEVYNIPNTKTNTVAYNTTITLEEGDNSIRFYGNGESLVPDLYSIKIEQIFMASSDLLYKFYLGELKNNAKIDDDTGFVKIDKKGNGYVILKVKVSTSALYDLQIQYISEFSDSYIKLDVNNSSTKIAYNLPMTGGMSNSKTEIFIIPKISLKSGENTLKFYGDGINPVAELGTLNIVKSPPLGTTLPSDDIYVKNGKLENGAKISAFSKNFVEGIGGVKDGFVILNIPINFYRIYNLTIEYLTDGDNRNLFVDINGKNTGTLYTLPKTDGLQESYAKRFSIPAELKRGVNTIKFYGDKVNGAPILGRIFINSDLELITYNLSKGILENGVIVDKNTNFVTKLGGSTVGSSTVEVPIVFKGSYYLTIKYLSPNYNSFLKVDVNNINTGTVYNFIKTSSASMEDAKSFSMKIKLDSGRNFIKFYGIKDKKSPDLESFIITDNSIVKSYKLIEMAILEKSKKSMINGYVCGIGGRTNGSATIGVNVDTEGVYNLTFKYFSPKISKPLKLAVNDVKLKTTYKLPATYILDENKANFFTVPIKLNSGDNIIKFYGNRSKEGPLIGDITVSLNVDPPLTIYKISDGILKGKVSVDTQTGLVNDIGLDKNSYVISTVNVASTGVYKLEIQYLSADSQRSLLLDINEESIKKEYKVPATINWEVSSVRIFSIEVKLFAGKNTIKFYSKDSTYAPLLGNFTIKPSLRSARILPINTYDLAEGNLQNGAMVDYTTGLVTNLGGDNNGFVTVTVNVKDTGLYSMTLDYLAKELFYTFIMEVNNNFDGDIYQIQQGKNKFHKDIILNKGDNTIKFIGNRKIPSPDLGLMEINPLVKI
ncbi:hypothetical protein, partial [Clostridium tarantellae]|uniref:hypothetical protein n=1 Tax=Clostridium tarantellae TaxID=39493 RepID=UPI0014793C72